MTSLYTPETAKWYNLLNQAQAATGYVFSEAVERYLADMLYRFGCDAEGLLQYPDCSAALQLNAAREQSLLRLQGAAERCLVTAGFFPEHANYAGLSLCHFIDTGRGAYHDLAEAFPGKTIYAEIDSGFGKVVDVLQQVGELSGVCQPIDLIQACELWQKEGSQFGRFVIERNTDAFPVLTACNTTH